jgi:hypothetical protein
LLSFGAEYFVFQFAVSNYEIKIHRTVIFSVILRGRETWSFTLREEHRLRVFENRVLRKIVRSKMEEIRQKWRKLHNDVPYTIHRIPFGRE